MEKDAALPIDPKFWDYLLSNAQKDWELFAYEQDFLTSQFVKTNALQVRKTYFIMMIKCTCACACTSQICRPK